MFNRLAVKLILPQIIVGSIFLFSLFYFAQSLSSNAILLAVLVMLIVQAVVSFLLNEKLLMSRLTRLKDYIEQMISTSEVPQAIVDNSSDELASITNEFSVFVSNLREIIEELRAESEMLHQGADELSKQMIESARSVDNTSSQIEQMAESIELVASTSEILSQNAVQVSDTTGQVITILEQGTKSSHTSQDSISAFVKEVAAMAGDLALLQEQSARIGSVLDVIRGIADQTNLLALNAAIEAARAGEQGRGFAVVADEVRALAHRTQESTVQIQSMVEGLQEKSTNAVNAMTRGQAQTQDSLAHSSAVVEALDKIREVFKEVDLLTSQIASGTSEQQQSTTSLNENMAKIVVISREIHQSLSLASEHAEQQRITTEQVDTTLAKICV